MSIRSGQSVVVEFTTASFSTGAATNADSLPTGTLVVNGVDNAATVTVTNVDTGRYKASVTLPTLAIGDVVELSIAATVSTVAGKAIVWRDTKDVLLDASGDVTFNNTSIATVTTVTNQLTAAQIATGVWQDATASDFTAANSIGKSLYTSGNAPGAASGLALVGSNMGTVTSVTGAVGSVTGNVGGSVVGDVQGKVLGGGVSALSGVGVQADLQTVKTQTITCAAGITINPNVGTTQPTNFTGTGASALVKSDLTDIAGSPVSASTAQLGVNVVNWSGTGVAAPNTAGVPIVDTRLVTRVGTAQAGTSTSITLDSGASATDNLYTHQQVAILSGTGAGQRGRILSAYVGATKVATVTPAWTTTPDATSVFELSPAAADVELSGITLASNVTQWNGSPVVAPNVAGVPVMDLSYVAGVTLGTHASGMVPADVRDFLGQAVQLDANNLPKVDCEDWKGVAVPAPNVAGAPIVDLGYSLGVSVTNSAGTAQAGTSTTITLAASASATDNIYRGRPITLVGGTGVGGAGIITAYVGSTKVATIDRTWPVTPDATTQYSLGDSAGVDLSQPVPTSNTSQTLGDALNAARAQGFGKWVQSGTSLTLYAADGTTVVRTFTLDSSSAPTQRV